jgi:NAD(P)-dependent dehydrogenase (short-subunit alcohol dehydrogenase family)
MGRLNGRIILVTGAGRGLGFGVARGLAGHGALVLGVARTAVELDELAQAIRADGGMVETHRANLADPAVIERLARDVLARHGRVDALINNAAVLRLKPFLDLTAAEFDETIAINLLAPARLTRELLPAMIAAGRGAIVNVSSAAGIQPFVDETDYCASKYGLDGFSYALALELQPHNISVNLVTPGARIKPTSITACEFASWSPERRAGYRDPLELADAFAFLALQDAQGITGQRFSALDLTERLHTHGWDGVTAEGDESSWTLPMEERST